MPAVVESWPIRPNTPLSAWSSRHRVLVITIEELDPSSKPCYVMERGAQGGSYKRIDDKDVPLSSTEVLALSSYERTSPSDRDAVPGTSVGDLDESMVDRTIERAYSLTPRAMRGAADKKTKMERLNFLDFQGNVTKPASLPRALPSAVLSQALH